ncbi:UDP-glucose 4-epimerase-like protein [Phycisphaerae bacterium]|nr:UDP-glucose 4-epimerase-like protein [Phycisphaerae bacterium]
MSDCFISGLCFGSVTDNISSSSVTDVPDYAQHMRGATALVTGGAGFIGSNIVDALLAAGARVRVLDDLSTGDRRNLFGPQKILDTTKCDKMTPDNDGSVVTPSQIETPQKTGVELIVGSVSDATAVRHAVAGCRHVFHLAAMVGISQSVHEPAKHFNTNILGTEIVLRESAAAKVLSVVFTSSSAVYGLTPTIPSSESDPLVAASPYAAGKAQGEVFTESYARTNNTHAASLRLFNVFGPRQSASGAYAAAIAAFLRAAQVQEPASLFGSGEQTRDFVPVANVVQAFLRASDPRRNLRGDRFNIGLGRATSLRQLLEMIADITQIKIPSHLLPPRDADSPHSCADISAATSALGFLPHVSMKNGLRETWNWLQSHANLST